MESWNSGIKELCVNMLPKNTDNRKINSVVEEAFSYIHKTGLETVHSSYNASDEYEIKDKIRKQLVGHSKDVRMQFGVLYDKLKCLEPQDKKRSSILKFLICLRHHPSKKRHVHYPPLLSSNTTNSFDENGHVGKDSDILNGDSYSSVKSYESPFSVNPVASSSKNFSVHSSSLFDHSRYSRSVSGSSKQVPVIPYESHPHNPSGHISTRNSLPVISNCTEIEIMRELLYCFHGIEGSQIIKYDADRIGFRLNPTVYIKSRHLVAHLIQLGYLYNLLKQHMQKLDKCKYGVVAQSLSYPVEDYIARYCCDIAHIDKAIQRYLSDCSDAPLTGNAEFKSTNIPTLMKLLSWHEKYATAFKCLTNIYRLLEDKRGGQIVSTLYNYVHNGNPALHTLLMTMLASAASPLYKMISQWIIKGEFTDRYGEFFIEHVPQSDKNDMWDKQFVLRKDLIPVFMKLEDAEQILQAGRCIYFLHNVCHERPQLTPAQKKLKESIDNGSGNLLQLLEPDNKFSSLIHQASIESSRLVLHSFNVNFNFTYHFEAFRKYMLLGQGDFIYRLMQALENDLNKTAGSIKHSRIIGILETALNSTKVDGDQEILNRLNIKILEAYQTEIGWDAFCLTYEVDGALNAIFKLNSGEYSRIFTFLWRIKRAEYFLCKIWRDTVLLLKICMHVVPEMRQIFSIASRLINQMLQFVSHFQYYIAFEVVQVSWCKFQNELNKMESLDKIVDAHSKFIKIVQQGCMLTDLDMLKNIRNLLDYVLELLPTMEILHANCEKELKRRNEYNANVEKYGTDCQNEAANVSHINAFHCSLKNSKSRLTVISKQYEESLCTFLMNLSRHKDPTLQILGNRIDFNEHYKNKNKSLSESFKLSRQSEYLNSSTSFDDSTLIF